MNDLFNYFECEGVVDYLKFTPLENLYLGLLDFDSLVFCMVYADRLDIVKDLLRYLRFVAL